MANISIIMCCYNSAGRITSALDHLAIQKASDDIGIELLVIDNNSKDNTQEVARSHWEKLGSPYEMKIIFEAQQGIIYARRTGINNAKSDYILFVDDDNLLCNNYLQKGIDILKSNPKIGIVGGFGHAKIDGNIPSWINPGFPFKSLLNSLAITTESTNKTGILEGKNDFVFGAASFYRKRIFDVINKISYQTKLIGRSGDILLSGEDMELSYIARMMGYQLYRTSEISFQHVIPYSRLDQGYFKKLFYGFGFSDLIISIYSEVLFKSTFNHNVNSLKTKSILKKNIFDTLYFVLKINKQKFFKLSLLSSFEDGFLAFYNKNEDIAGIVKEIEQLYTQLSKTEIV